MSNRLARSALCVAIAFAVALGLSLSFVSVARSHDARTLAQAQIKRHAELRIELSSHGHVHDDGVEHERSPGHLHGHNSGDHTHETPGTAPMVLIKYAFTGDEWSANDFVPHIPRPQFLLDRPPRVSVVA